MLSALFDDAPALETVNAIGFAGDTLGNHNFNRGSRICATGGTHSHRPARHRHPDAASLVVGGIGSLVVTDPAAAATAAIAAARRADAQVMVGLEA